MRTIDTAKAADALYASIIAVDRNSARNLVEQLLADGSDPMDIIQNVLDPSLARIGGQWAEQQITLAQAFVGSKIAEDVMNRVKDVNCSDRGFSPKGTVVIGNIEDDFHSLGRRIVVSYLEANNWQVIDLGNDVLSETFIDEALRAHAKIIAASAMMHTTALNIAKIREDLERRNLEKDIFLAAGGAVFNWRPDLLEKVGATITAPNAAAVNKAFMAAIGLRVPL
jgi:methanogenic corrinoid protein MtbC1